MSKNKKDKFIDIMHNPSMKLFTMLCGYVALVLILYTLCQIINFRNSLGLIQILSIVLPLIFYVYNADKKKIKEIIIVSAIYLSLLLILPFVWQYTYDLSADGNSYHKSAVAFIKNGWNPLYETSKEFQEQNDQVVPISEDSKIDLWIEHYPKATWILGAVIYNMTNNIESGKCITILFLVMTLIISYNCLRVILDKKWAVLLSLLICFNPITMAQIFTYYVDCLMGFCFVIELLLLLLINPMEKQNKLIWLGLLSICIFFTNIKFTGLLCSGVLAAVFYFYWFFKHRKDKDFWIRFRNITLHFVVVFVTAIFFVGNSSYVKNTFEHKNPLYPLFGDGKVDIITTMQPKSFGEKNMFEKFVISTFSKTQNVLYTTGEPTLKLPIQLYKSEISELLAPDVRIAGFGPFFALTLIITIVVFIISLTLFIKHEKKNLKYITLPAIAILISMFLVGEMWWARYIPQFYLFPIGTIALTIYTKKYYNKEIIPKIMAIVLSFVLVINIGTFAYAVLEHIQAFVEIEKDLKVLKDRDNPKLKLGGEQDLYGHFYNLKDKNIEYTVVDEFKEGEAIYMCYWRFEVEIDEKVSETN